MINVFMKVEYKRVKVLMPFCSVCKEQLSGDNSIILPYKCFCGEWQSTWENPHYFTIKKERGTT
jgi:hypothetical protein